AHDFTRLARGFTRFRGDDRFFDDLARDGGILFQEPPEVFTDSGFYRTFDLARNELRLRLRIEGWVGVFDVNHAHDAFTRVVAREPLFDVFEQAGAGAVGVQGASQ